LRYDGAQDWCHGQICDQIETATGDQIDQAGSYRVQLNQCCRRDSCNESSKQNSRAGFQIGPYTELHRNLTSGVQDGRDVGEYVCDEKPIRSPKPCESRAEWKVDRKRQSTYLEDGSGGSDSVEETPNDIETKPSQQVECRENGQVLGRLAWCSQWACALLRCGVLLPSSNWSRAPS